MHQASGQSKAFASSSSNWSARDYAVLIVAIAASLCLLAIIGTILYLVGTNKIDPSHLGKAEGVGKGSGLLGLLGLVVYLAVKLVSPAEKNERKKHASTWWKKTLLPAFGLITTVGIGFFSSTAASNLQSEINLKKEKEELTKQVTALRQSREEALAFLASLSAKENLHLVDKRVNWLAITTAIESLPPGQRKTAAYGALLLAWKDIPLNLGSSSVRTGVDSPGFFKKVFDSTSLPISQAPGERLSDSMKKQFRKVDQPKIGDLLFYKGAEATSVGNFVMMYLGPGLEGGHGVCLGTFERGQPIQVIDSYYFDQTPPKDMFIGYYEPNYRD